VLYSVHAIKAEGHGGDPFLLCSRRRVRLGATSCDFLTGLGEDDLC